MEQELKIKKWRVWFSCLLLAYIIATGINGLSKVFTVNVMNAQKPLLSVNPIISNHPRFKWTGYVFKNFFMHYPYVVLLLFVCIFLFLFCIFFYFCKLLVKGYVARMSSDGLLLANNRLIPWHEIEAIEVIEAVGGRPRVPDKVVITLKEAPTKNMIMRWFKKISNEKIVLTYFSLPLQEAYEMLVSYWHQYR